ncbi:MAG: indole-3-glycerol phosphate synthase TrpC [Sulfobacillus sp.]|nr:indole-3-glycerol phosphate synthase TrpC [Sulfobacillus sp.]
MFLDRIVTSVDARVEALRDEWARLEEKAQNMPPTRSLADALRAEPGTLQVIAECKQRSPSKGWLTDRYDPVAQAQGYQRAGAAAISVLTEPEFFAGDLGHLRAVRDAVSIPVLRKDFIRHPVQIAEARAAGADAVLLIIRILEPDQYRALYDYATRLGLDVLVEIHSPVEAEVALTANPAIIGVNNRDLDSFETRLSFSQEMAVVLGPDIIKVSESGIHQVEDLRQVRDWGYQAVLVGEALMRGRPLLEEWRANG